MKEDNFRKLIISYSKKGNMKVLFKSLQRWTYSKENICGNEYIVFIKKSNIKNKIYLINSDKYIHSTSIIGQDDDPALENTYLELKDDMIWDLYKDLINNFNNLCNNSSNKINDSLSFSIEMSDNDLKKI